MLEFVLLDKKCRTQILLNYFGETFNRECGLCDICLQQKSGELTSRDFSRIEKEIYKLLQADKCSLDTIIARIPFSQEKIVETGIIDIALRDIHGNVRKLTDLKGKVVLLDFSVFQSPAGAPHNMLLRELYNKYASQGLEIYQISLDADEHYWKTAAANLPWICVRDGNGVYSTNVAVYNVRQVPSIFLINRNNELKLRGEDIKDLEASVKSLL